jgi:hypothetical protein
MDVLVFKTSVEDTESVLSLSSRLDSLAGTGHWNFALDDCDRILRITSPNVRPEMAIRILVESGFDCLELED